MKKEYRPFKKHFWIPFSLVLLILVAGIIMTLTNQVDIGKARGRSSSNDFVLTGPGVIILGSVLSIFMLYFKKYIK